MEAQSWLDQTSHREHNGGVADLVRPIITALAYLSHMVAYLFNPLFNHFVAYPVPLRGFEITALPILAHGP